MRIYIGKKDIEVAQKLNRQGGLKSANCPISQSLKRRGYENPRTDFKIISINGKDTFLIDDKGQEFIINFDSGQNVYPCYITLNEVSE